MTKIAFIGLGNMGGGMAANQAKAGHAVKAFDLSQAALDRAKDNGCDPVGSVVEAVKDAANLDIDEQLIATVAKSKWQIDEKEYSSVCGLAKDAIAYAQKRKLDAQKRKLDEAAVCHPGRCVPLSSLRPQVQQDRWFEAKFDIDPDRLPFVFDWSRSNLEYLFDLGYVSGEDLADELIGEGWKP